MELDHEFYKSGDLMRITRKCVRINGVEAKVVKARPGSHRKDGQIYIVRWKDEAALKT